MEDIYKFVVDNETYEKILAGKKIIQIALNTPPRKAYAIGNLITFVRDVKDIDITSLKKDAKGEISMSVNATIENLFYFTDIREAVESLGKEKCGFKPSQSFERASDTFLSKETYEQVAKNGLVAVQFKLND